MPDRPTPSEPGGRLDPPSAEQTSPGGPIYAILRRSGWLARAALLGPAFVASVAYVDPGNVAANLTAGARYSYALVWVLVVANAMAMLIQYQSAKLGLVTGKSLPALVSERMRTHRFSGPLRAVYAVQAIGVAMATDVAEVVGGAFGLNLLFGIPMWLGGLIVGIASIVLLSLLRNRGERTLEIGVSVFLLVIAIGFLGTLLWAPPQPAGVLGGLAPSIPDNDAWPLIAAMLGATVMPHAIYLHSALARDRFLTDGQHHRPLRGLLRVQKVDVFAALVLAGSVNIAMLLLAAALPPALAHSEDPIRVAHNALATAFGPIAGAVFGLGLLASGLGSAIVGTHSGAQIMADLFPWRWRPNVRRAVTLGPAIAVLLIGLQPSTVLVWSQVVLSFGIGFATVPLTLSTGHRALMGDYVDPVWLRVVNWAVVAAIVSLNLIVVGWTVGLA